MKKLFRIILVILILAAGVCAYNVYSDNYLVDLIKDAAINATATTQTTTACTLEKSSYEVSPINLYEKLSDDEKKAYDSIYQGWLNHKETIIISLNLDNETVSDLIELVLREHPEIFYISDSYTADNFGRLKFDYRYDEKQSEELYKKIEEKSKQILSGVAEDADDYEKSLYIYDYLAENVYYDNNALSDLSADRDVSTIVGPLLQGRAVCGGYAAAYQYLLKLSGVEALYVSGVADTPGQSGDHAWVVQQSNGEYYYTDPTWGDSFDDTETDNMPDHTYFCITTQELEKTHTLDKGFDFPEFTAKEDNYFVREGLYFDEYSAEEIRKAIEERTEEGSFNIEIKFGSKGTYNDAIDNLIKDGKIYFIIKKIDPFSKTIDGNSISYINDDEHLILTLMLKSA